MERVRPEIRFDDDWGGGGDGEGGRTGCDGDGSDGGSGHYSCGDGGDGNSIGDACRTYVIAHFGAATNTGVGSRSDPPPRRPAPVAARAHVEPSKTMSLVYDTPPVMALITLTVTVERL